MAVYSVVRIHNVLYGCDVWWLDAHDVMVLCDVVGELNITSRFNMISVCHVMSAYDVVTACRSLRECMQWWECVGWQHEYVRWVILVNVMTCDMIVRNDRGPGNDMSVRDDMHLCDDMRVMTWVSVYVMLLTTVCLRSSSLSHLSWFTSCLRLCSCFNVPSASDTQPSQFRPHEHIHNYVKSFTVNLKRGYIEFKYYADAIHSYLTPPG